MLKIADGCRLKICLFLVCVCACARVRVCVCVLTRVAQIVTATKTYNPTLGYGHPPRRVPLAYSHPHISRVHKL